MLERLAAGNFVIRVRQDGTDNTSKTMYSNSEPDLAMRARLRYKRVDLLETANVIFFFKRLWISIIMHLYLSLPI